MPKKRDYAKEYREYHGKPEQIANRSSRNQARRSMEERGLVRKGDGREVDHRNRNPRDNSPSNLRVMSRKANRSRKK